MKQDTEQRIMNVDSIGNTPESTFANDHDNQIDNKSGNKPFNSFFKTGCKRRSLLKGSTMAAVTSYVVGMSIPKAALADSDSRGLGNFRPVLLAKGNSPIPIISDDYQYDVLIPWGEPLEPFGPEFSDPPSSKSVASFIAVTLTRSPIVS